MNKEHLDKVQKLKIALEKEHDPIMRVKLENKISRIQILRDKKKMALKGGIGD